MEHIFLGVITIVAIIFVLISLVWAILFFIVGLGLVAHMLVKYLAKRPLWKTLSVLSIVFCVIGFGYSFCGFEFQVSTPEVIYVGPALP